VAPITQRVSDAAAGLLLRSATVTAVADHGDFRTIDLTGDRLGDVDWVPGDKIRIRAGALALRTYTPISWDRPAGRTRIIAYLHGHGPGSEWSRAARVGSSCHLRGPDRSVRLDRLSVPPVFVGDETSIGLLVALRDRGTVAPAATLLEVAGAEGVGPVLTAYGIDDAESFARGDGGSGAGALVAAVVETVRRRPDAPLVLTGRAQTIAAIRRTLKAQGSADRPAVVKAYWDENRKGLD
jgi:ferric-chelate reductase (NADPH)